MQVEISIIIPVFNVEKYLKDCLCSILNQRFSNYEIICVDDGSTDCSSKILDEYACLSDKIHVIHQDNKGQSCARNRGVESAKGEFICFLDSDDLLAPDALEKMWKSVIDTDIEVLTYEIHSLWYEDDYLRNNKNKDAYYKINHEYIGIKRGCDFFVDKIEKNDFIDSACLMLIRTKWLKEKGITFYPKAIFEDSIYAIDCYFQCEKMKHLNEGLYIYRVRENSTMTERYSFKHLYYRMWQYGEILKMIYTYAKTEREISALASYAEKSIANIKYIYRNLDKSEKSHIYQLTGLYALLGSSVGIYSISNDYNNELKIIGLLSEIKNSKEVLIYGAGVVGNKIRKYICMNGYVEKIIGFAISEEKTTLSLDGLSIKCISDYKVSENLLLIIAAQENYHRDMLEMAQKYTYTKIRMIDYEMECIIDEYLKKTVL